MTNHDDEIAKAAARCVEMSEQRGGGVLDYSEASLAIVEEILQEVVPFWGGMSFQEREMVGRDLGCYLLEVARREFGGEYQWSEENDQPVLVVERTDCRVALMTLNKVCDRAAGDEADNIPFFFDGFASRVREAKPGTNALYV
ncbi:hypothetical protein LOC68_21305 [Blastopirellula sp. JC732]|uniref:Uncharacterized protein n=1 Tax=Blastopirellula sediminis TaxID=2894196 RepID=A0A9X1MQ99_9BACT|nr:hypothetical protein [Blastopirellula sediminis]MCC9605764.1 hypothetical protein [Blastopirellula sediminis]MCC9630936.1 hypothetical protein [Blastopirellula sediminis]